ncbi:hypothetical protein ACO2Q0_18065 [Phenylobacterium sp. VNQ135]
MRLAAAAGDLHWPGLILAAGLVVAIFGVVLVIVRPSLGPAERAYGRVLTVNVSANESGPQIVARVRTEDGDRTLFLPTGSTCWPGDRIELLKRGKQYMAGGRCARP